MDHRPQETQAWLAVFLGSALLESFDIPFRIDVESRLGTRDETQLSRRLLVEERLCALVAFQEAELGEMTRRKKHWWPESGFVAVARRHNGATGIVLVKDESPEHAGGDGRLITKHDDHRAMIDLTHPLHARSDGGAHALLPLGIGSDGHGHVEQGLATFRFDGAEYHHHGTQRGIKRGLGSVPEKGALTIGKKLFGPAKAAGISGG
jgi:hypothetical protein